MTQSQTSQPVISPPSLVHAFITIASIIGIISVGLFYLEASIHGLLLICILVGAISAWSLGYNFVSIRQAMNKGISDALSAIYIFILIGALIAAFIESGTLAYLIYYGIEFVSPAIFLPAGMVLCSLMSITTGTSWGTVGTIGVVLMGIGSTLGIPAPIVAGMVISGACFGDKMSPMSDTTNLSAMSAKVGLYNHIGSMVLTTGPTYILTLLIFSVLGFNYAGQTLPVAELQNLQAALSEHFNLNILTLLPLIIMLALSVLKVAAEPTMMAAIVSASVLAIILQQQEIALVLNSLYEGGSIQTGMECLDSLLGRGGITSMMWTLSLSLLALALGGILESCQCLRVLISAVLERVKKASTLVATTLCTCLLGNMAMGEAYMSIILGGQLFGAAYDDNKLDRRVLSRSLEEGATLTTALIPWTTGGAFFASALGVSVVDYAPWALLNWINPLISIAFACLGIALFRQRSSLNTIPAADGNRS